MKKTITIISTVLLTISAALSHATTISAVNSQSCKKVAGRDKPFILVLKTGENIADAILRCADDAHLSGATLAGLGALQNPTLTYFNHETKKYQEKTFPATLELLSLSGNITQGEDGKRIIHLHVSLSDDQYQMMGGHLGKATIGATAEIVVTPLTGHLVKKMNKEAGIPLLQTES